MIPFFFIVISLIGVSWQLTTLAEISFLSSSPNLILSVILASAILRQKLSKSSWLVFLPALWFDLLSGYPFGIIMLGFWSSFFLIDFLASKWIKESDLPAKLSLLLIGISFFEISQVLLSGLFFHLNLTEAFSFNIQPFCFKLVASILMNSILGLILFGIFNKSIFLHKNDWAIKFK
jgi:hypothetical protein